MGQNYNETREEPLLETCGGVWAQVSIIIVSVGKGGFTINKENKMQNNNDNANLSPHSAAGL